MKWTLAFGVEVKMDGPNLNWYKYPNQPELHGDIMLRKKKKEIGCGTATTIYVGISYVVNFLILKYNPNAVYQSGGFAPIKDPEKTLMLLVSPVTLPLFSALKLLDMFLKMVNEVW